MTSSTGNGEERSVEDRIKHPDLFPDLRAKMKGTRPRYQHYPTITTVNSPLTLQIHIFTK